MQRYPRQRYGAYDTIRLIEDAIISPGERLLAEHRLVTFHDFFQQIYWVWPVFPHEWYWATRIWQVEYRLKLTSRGNKDKAVRCRVLYFLDNWSRIPPLWITRLKLIMKNKPFGWVFSHVVRLCSNHQTFLNCCCHCIPMVVVQFIFLLPVALSEPVWITI